MTNRELYKIGKTICKALDISPKISFDESFFDEHAEGCGYYDPEEECVHVSKRIAEKRVLDKREAIYEISYALAHEIRHHYQHKKYGLYVLNYDSSQGYDAYNKNPAEIDANAFAALFICSKYHIEGIPDMMYDKPISSMITKRMKEIAKTERLNFV